jgi:RNA polymerase sigma factor (sigma-70 family)
MTNKPLRKVLDHVHKLAAAGACSALSDAELLARFAGQRDEASFAVLVERHGPMVLRVCWRVLGNGPDAEDACQAAFFILARKAASIRKGQSLASWLHAVARNAALRLRKEIARRRAREGPPADVPQKRGGAGEASWGEVMAFLDEELQRLPETWRAALVLCYLEGKTRDEAAAALGVSTNVLRGRLERGRERLRVRLLRRGVSFPAALVAAGFTGELTPAAVPATLVVSTIKAATSVAAGQAVAPGLVSVRVAALTEGVLKMMFVTKLKTAVAVLVAVSVLGAGAGVFAQRGLALGAAESRGLMTVAESQAEDNASDGAERPQDAKARLADAERLLEEAQRRVALVKETVEHYRKNVAAGEKGDKDSGKAVQGQPKEARPTRLKIPALVEAVDPKSGTISVRDQSVVYTFLTQQVALDRGTEVLLDRAAKGGRTARYADLPLAKDAKLTVGKKEVKLEDLKVGTHAELELGIGRWGSQFSPSVKSITPWKLCCPSYCQQQRRSHPEGHDGHLREWVPTLIRLSGGNAHGAALRPGPSGPEPTAGAEKSNPACNLRSAGPYCF